MRSFEQIEKFGIRNPYGTDPLEGDWVAIALNDGNEVCGTLKDAGIFDFTLETEDGKEMTFLLNRIIAIRDVAKCPAGKRADA